MYSKAAKGIDPKYFHHKKEMAIIMPHVLYQINVLHPKLTQCQLYLMKLGKKLQSYKKGL